MVKAILLLCVYIFCFTGAAYAELPPNCLSYTEFTYNIPHGLLEAIHNTEGGKPGTIARNKNGTVDVGPMQHNSSNFHRLAQYGVAPQQLLNSGCVSVYVAGWELAEAAKHLARTPLATRINPWVLAIAAYNAGEGAVMRAARKATANTAYAELALPVRTRDEYVPKVLRAWHKNQGVASAQIQTPQLAFLAKQQYNK